MKRNFKLKAYTTMLDVLCDYLIAFKESIDGRGLVYPSAAAANTTMEREAPKVIKQPVRPMTSGA